MLLAESVTNSKSRDHKGFEIFQTGMSKYSNSYNCDSLIFLSFDKKKFCFVLI